MAESPGLKLDETTRATPSYVAQSYLRRQLVLTSARQHGEVQRATVVMIMI